MLSEIRVDILRLLTQIHESYESGTHLELLTVGRTYLLTQHIKFIGRKNNTLQKTPAISQAHLICGLQTGCLFPTTTLPTRKEQFKTFGIKYLLEHHMTGAITIAKNRENRTEMPKGLRLQ